jgi:hypothetical protein
MRSDTPRPTAIIGAGIAGLACALGAHRWRYAQPDVFAAGEAVNLDYRLSASGLALCGDGWRGPRVEDAWLSGHHLGEALVADAT